MANRQGRVIGTNMAGGNAEFKGAVGSFVVKTFDTALAGAGLSVTTAQKAGFDAVGIQVAQFDRAHFYPKKRLFIWNWWWTAKRAGCWAFKAMAERTAACLPG